VIKMAKIVLQEENISAERQSQEEPKKLRKKNARRAAKIKLQIGRAQKNVQKAEQKVTRAQAKLEAKKGQVQALEQKLSRFHSKQHATNGSVSDDQANLSPLDTSVYDENGEAISETYLASLPPAEGRDDIATGAQDQPNVATEEAYQSPLSDTVGPVASSSAPDEDAEASMETNLSSPPPVEGRDDIPATDAETQHTAEHEEAPPEEIGSSHSKPTRRRRS
jgi:hypothetical protein